MWVLLVLGSTFAPTLAAGVANPLYSAIYPTSQLPDNGNLPRPAPRQLTPPVPTNPTATSTTFDFWWPFPVSPTTTSPQVVVTVPIATVASVIAASSAPATEPSQASDLSSVSSVALTPSVNTSRTSTGLSSSTLPSSSPAPVANTIAKAPSKLNYLIPIFSGVGVIFLVFATWVLYGCCTRRPRVRTDDGELICGPPYVGNNENDARRDIRYQSHDQEDIGMLEIPKRGRRVSSGQFRWPSFNEPPPFDPVKGFYVPDEYKEDEDDYYTASLAPPTAAGNTRSKSLRTQKYTATKRSAGAGPSGTASIFSDATSVALLEMYESDEEAESRRRAKEVPWESLRHKSIKRGILEQVKKENKWMDSIRGSISGGSAFLSGHRRRKDDEEKRLTPDNDDHDDHEKKNDPRPIGKRRGHARADSDFSIDASKSPSFDIPSARLCEDTVMPLKPSKAKKMPDESMKPAPGVRRGFARLKDDPEDLDKYTPLPTRSTENRSKSRSRSRSRSRSSSPVKRPSISAASCTTSWESRARPISRNILPNSPPQIMSPPLESQMCFTPIPPLMDVMLSPVGSSRTRSKSTLSKGNFTAVSTTASKKTRKLHARTSPPLPFPGGNGLTSRPEAYRGRLVKKRTLGSSGPGSSSSSKRLPARPLQDEGSDAHSTAEGDEALRKVDKIMESSCSARDVIGDEAIRCLSPPGFGKQVY